MKPPQRIKSHLKGEGDSEGCLIFVFVVVCVMIGLAVFGGGKGGNSSGSSSSSSSSSSSNQSTLTGSMNGHAWNSASSASKQSLCLNMAKKLSDMGVANVSSGFIYGALEEFYSSSEPSILNTSISDVAALTVHTANNLNE